MRGMRGANFCHHAQAPIGIREEKETLREGRRSSPCASPRDGSNFHHEEMRGEREKAEKGRRNLPLSLTHACVCGEEKERRNGRREKKEKRKREKKRLQREKEGDFPPRASLGNGKIYFERERERENLERTEEGRVQRERENWERRDLARTSA